MKIKDVVQWGLPVEAWFVAGVLFKLLCVDATIDELLTLRPPRFPVSAAFLNTKSTGSVVTACLNINTKITIMLPGLQVKTKTYGH